MIQRKALICDRIRNIKGSFAWVPHKFLRGNFWTSLSQHELILYLFLVMAADRQGLSYYSFDRICSILSITPDAYILARDNLIEKDLIAFDGHMFQVLSLPECPVVSSVHILTSKKDMNRKDPATVQQIIRKCIGGHNA
ncbi:MAG: hypothetical protein H8D87_18640 [Deltaproteobacteria bacterium]|nr:hypothetical protein [Candidatus Desulfobacula maris]